MIKSGQSGVAHTACWQLDLAIPATKRDLVRASCIMHISRRIGSCTSNKNGSSSSKVPKITHSRDFWSQVFFSVDRDPSGDAVSKWFSPTESSSLSLFQLSPSHLPHFGSSTRFFPGESFFASCVVLACDCAAFFLSQWSCALSSLTAPPKILQILKF
jgi:hypothetical protein